MLLAIDVGNTNTVFAVHDGDGFVADWRCATEHQRTADEYFVWLRSLMALQEVVIEVDAVVISSVVPQVVFNLRVLCNRYFGCRPVKMCCGPRRACFTCPPPKYILTGRQADASGHRCGQYQHGFRGA